MPLEMKYFVLKPHGDGPHAHASREAMRAYALAIRPTDPEMYRDLWDWAWFESPRGEGEPSGSP